MSEKYIHKVATVEAKTKRDAVYAPTHICAVCEKKEIPNSIVAFNAFWLCTDCLSALKKLIREGKEE